MKRVPLSSDPIGQTFRELCEVNAKLQPLWQDLHMVLHRRPFPEQPDSDEMKALQAVERIREVLRTTIEMLDKQWRRPGGLNDQRGSGN